jgi:hypothetical protein
MDKNGEPVGHAYSGEGPAPGGFHRKAHSGSAAPSQSRVKTAGASAGRYAAWSRAYRRNAQTGTLRSRRSIAALHQFKERCRIVQIL